MEKELKLIIDVMESKKAEDIKIYDMRGKSSLYDYSILATGSSNRNVEAIVTEIKKTLENIRGIEGAEESSWVLIDADDYIINVFQKEAREYYKLDEFYESI